MAAALEESPSSLLVPTSHTKRLEGTLVAPRKRQAVPNHLADTKLFGRPSSCTGPLQIQPSTVNFQGFNIGSTYRQMIRIVNSTNVNQSMHIIPPETEYFKIKYSKKTSSLVPGLSLNVAIEFRPTHWRHYTDCVRIHCKGENNVLIPVHAFLVANTSSFPRNLNFPPTPVGQTQTKSLSLRSDVPEEFEFRLSYLKLHSAFNVDPVKGTIPQNGETKLKVTFAPTEFLTATMELQLEVSQFNFVPLLCSVTGTSTPGLSMELLKQHLLLSEYTQHKLRSISPPQSSHVSEPPMSLQSSHLSCPSQENIILSSSSPQPTKLSQQLEQSSQQLLLSQSSLSAVKESQSKQVDELSPLQSPIGSSHPHSNSEISKQPPQSSESLVSAQSSRIQSSQKSYHAPPIIETCSQEDITESRKKPIVIKSSATSSPIKKQIDSDDFYMDGFHIPVNINTHSAVGMVLLQQPGKLKASQLKRDARKSCEDDIIISAVSSKQIKESGFLQSIKQIASDEKTNHFRWIIHMGGAPPTLTEEQIVQKERVVHNKAYQDSMHVSTKDILENHYVTHSTSRTKRVANEWPNLAAASFDCHRNNLWVSRLHAHQKFIQAVRKVMFRFRAQENLKKLMKMRSLVIQGKCVEEAINLMYPKKSSIISVASLLHLKMQDFHHFSFPIFSGQIESNEGLKQSLDQDQVDDKGVSLPDMKEDFCYLDLEVPEQSYLLGYTEFLTPRTGSYVSMGFYKQFLSGATGEMESLSHIPGVNSSLLVPDAFKPKLASLLPEEKSVQRSKFQSTPSPTIHLSEASSSFSLPPPSIDHRTTLLDDDVLNLVRRKTAPAMGRTCTAVIIPETEKQEKLDILKSIERKPINIPDSLLTLSMPSSLQILNPSPEVIDYFSMLPNSEAQLDHTLLPLPLYNSSRYPVIELDPLDVIPGLMTWKKFSSPCLSTLEKERMLSSSWKPCRTDPFFTAGLLPQDPVELVDMMSGPLKDDMVNAEKFCLPMTMDNIKSMFQIPLTHNSKEESGIVKKHSSMLIQDGLNELEEHHFKSFNQLGVAIKSRFDSFMDISADNDTQ